MVLQTQREIYQAKLNEIRSQYKTATGFRRKDLARCIRRMEKELMFYDANFKR